MSWGDGVRHRLRTLFRATKYGDELDDEMRFHVELDAMQQRDELRAVRRFGNRTYYKEEARRMTWLGTLDVMRQDLGYVWRTMTRSPGLTMTIVATLALGIGVNAAVFTVLDRLYLRAPGGVEDPTSLRRYWVERFNTYDGVPHTSQHLTYPMYRVLAESSGASSSIAVFSTGHFLRQGTHPRDPRVRGIYASANYFPTLGVRAALGRFFSSYEDQIGKGALVAVISHDFWRRRLGGDSAILGQPLAIDSNAYTIIGVAEPAFTGLELQDVDVWLPLASMPPSFGKPWWEPPSNFSFRAFQRLPNTSAEHQIAPRATQQFRALAGELNPMRPDSQQNVFLGSIIEARGPGSQQEELLMATRLGGVAVIVFLIVCANVINLLLARAVRRRREIAVRLALGISRARLVRLLTTETLVLALIAGVAALLAAAWGGGLLRSLLMPEIEWHDSPLDWRVAAFTGAVALMAGLVAGIIPALQASRPDLSGTLKSGSKTSVRHPSRLRAGLVMTQAALSVVLLVGAALFTRSLQAVQSLDIGFDARRLLFGNVGFALGESPPRPVIGAAMRDIAEHLESRPGVEAVARAGNQPMRGFGIVTYFSGADSGGGLGPDHPTVLGISPGFFRAAGIQVLRGRGFTRTETDAAPAEMVVTEAATRLLWPYTEPIGQCIRFVKRENSCYTVVGVVEDVRRDRVLEDPVPQFYLPLGNMPIPGWNGTTLIVRAQPNATAIAAGEVLGALRHAFPAAEATVTPMTENLEPEYRPWRLGATLFTAFGLLALLVTLIGVFSTVSYDVSQRTHEFGVRVALGARMGDVLRQVVGEGVRTIAIGIALGLMLALAAGRLIAALLYGIEPNDPGVLISVAAMLLIVAGAATLAPAWRAASADPVIAPRAD